jgi:hypothetical protein
MSQAKSLPLNKSPQKYGFLREAELLHVRLQNLVVPQAVQNPPLPLFENRLLSAVSPHDTREGGITRSGARAFEISN